MSNANSNNGNSNNPGWFLNYTVFSIVELTNGFANNIVFATWVRALAHLLVWLKHSVVALNQRALVAISLTSFGVRRHSARKAYIYGIRRVSKKRTNERRASSEVSGLHTV